MESCREGALMQEWENGRMQPSDDLLSSLMAQAQRARNSYAGTVEPLESIAARGVVKDFLTAHLDELTDAMRTVEPVHTTPAAHTLGRVFSYWDSPLTDAPPLVRACIRQLRRTHPDAIVLDHTTVGDYVDIPGAVADRLRERPAHYSDFLRVSLLELYGGMWVDATCYVPEALAPAVLPTMRQGVLYLRWRGRQISNWFIAAEPNNLLITLQRAALELWWTHRDDLPDYFLYHRVFESLISLVPDAHAMWRRVPRVSTIPSHVLQLAMFQRYDPDDVRLLLDAAFIQKLSYKYDAAAASNRSILAHILNDTLIAPAQRGVSA